MSSEMPRSTGNWKALFISPNNQLTLELLPLVSHHPAVSPASQLRTYPTPRELQDNMAAHGANLCFLDVTSDPDRALECLADVLAINSAIPVIAVLSGDDSNLILRCLRQGATEFLGQPFAQEQLDAAMAKIARLNPASVAKRARVYLVVPAKGGCGATTIATNLAWQWKRLGAKRILLADLDPLAGTLSFLLKIKGTFSFLDVLHRSGDIDEDLWKAMVTSQNGVDVLLSPDNPGEGQSDLSDAAPVIEYARYHYDVAILDTNSVYGRWNLSQAQAADEVLLITTNELPALQAAQRSLAYLQRNQIGRWKTRVIVNRYERGVGLEQDVIGTALDVDICHVLPSDTDAVQKSLMDGKLIQPGSAMGRSVHALADRLAGREQNGNKSASLASSLLSLFSRSTS
ncbi:MAG: AAA family ATPase [Bryobacteraceae bacterium]|jgi:pilus assembly protein CpaE